MAGTTPLSISVVMPCYNAAPFLAEALESVAAQTRAAGEIVVIDDASTDATAEIAEQFGARVVRLPENVGVAHARNVGVATASCDVIAFLDGDDRWEPDHLETLVALLDKYPEAGAALGGVQLFGDLSTVPPGFPRTVRSQVPPGEPVDAFWQAVRTWLHLPSGTVFRRDALNAIGGFKTDHRVAEDYDVFLRLARRYPVVSTDQITAHWRRHRGQSSVPAERSVSARALYDYRWQLWQELQDVAEPAFRERYRQTTLSAWDYDMRDSLYFRDFAAVRYYCDLAKFVPGAPLGNRIAWWLIGRIPPPLMRVVDRLRGRPMKDEAGQ